MAPWRIPLFDTVFDEQEEEAILRPLRAGWLTMGDEVLMLEDELKAATGAEHAIAVSSGTMALQLACAAIGIGPDDEVVCPTLTFAATANIPRSAGAKVHLVGSVGPQDLTIDPKSIAEHVTPATKAILVVHYAGFACDMEEILKVAGEYDIPIIEDAAHAVFTRHRGTTLGLHGRVGCFSFYSNKNATSGEGGALVTNDPELADKLRLLRSNGMTVPTLDRHRGIATSYDVVLAGFNGRMDEIRAALLRVQLSRLPGFLERRRDLFALYLEGLSGSRVQVPFSEGRFMEQLPETGVHIMPVLLPPEVDRKVVMSHLKEAGIQTSIHYPPIHRFKLYRDDRPDLRPTAALADRELTLPLYPTMEDQDVRAVIDELAACLGNA
jgi:dTDP-4-amino-4,6-dideoxygalactose transaminase